MYLGDYHDGANRAASSRRRMHRRGTTPKGASLWTTEEDELCRRFGHDYSLLQRKLPWRTYQALRTRCQMLGLRPRRQQATASDISRLRRLYPTGSAQALKAAFPQRETSQLKRLARYHGIRRARRNFKPTGVPIIDGIRQRCFELNYSMVDLDEVAKTARYFQKAGWHNSVNYTAIGRAIVALDGQLSARWNDDDA